MPDETRRLLSAAEKMATLTDTLSAEFAADLAVVLRAIERRMVPLLRALESPAPLPNRRTTTAVVARLIALREQVRQVLAEAGYDGLIETATSSAFARMLETVRESRVGRAASRFFTSPVVDRLNALRELVATDILRQGDVVARALYRSVRDSVLGGAPTDQVLERLAAQLDLEVREVRTLYDTATSTFGRVMEQQASDGTADELFLYAGPVDAKMRDFCRAHIGQVFTREAIVTLDNGQGLDVFLTGGGWNCRHVWMRLSDASDLAPLANTGERAPEVVDALRRVRPVTRAKAA